jgi:NADH-quinone oxidoreductase E subunit
MTSSNSKRITSVEEGFQFTPENMIKVQEFIKKYPEGRQASAVLPLLDLAQRQCGGWLPQPAIEEVAQLLGMPAIRVYEVATFYSMFNLTPVGKYHLQLCGTTPCWLRGANELKAHCEHRWGIKEGQVTSNGQFSLVEVECLGACVNAPVIQINDDFYEDLTPELLDEVLQKLSQNEACPAGSQIGRQKSAPEGFEAPLKKSPSKTVKSRKKTEDVSAE